MKKNGDEDKVKIGNLSQIRSLQSSKNNDVIINTSRRTSLLSCDERLHNNSNNSKVKQASQLLKLRRNTLEMMGIIRNNNEEKLKTNQNWSNLIPDKTTSQHRTALLLNVHTKVENNGRLEVTSPLSSTVSSPQFSDDDVCCDDVCCDDVCCDKSLMESAVVQDFIFSPPHVDSDDDYDVTVPATSDDVTVPATFDDVTVPGTCDDVTVPSAPDDVTVPSPSDDDNHDGAVVNRPQKSEVWEIATRRSQIRRPSQLGGSEGAVSRSGPLPVIRTCQSINNDMMTSPVTCGPPVGGGKLSVTSDHFIDQQQQRLKQQQHHEDTRLNEANCYSSESSLVFSIDDNHIEGCCDEHNIAPPCGEHHEPSDLPTRPIMRRTAVVSTLPESDLSVLSDRIATLQRNQPMGICNSDIKRSRWNLGKLGFKHNKERCAEAKLISAMNELKCKIENDDQIDERIQQLIKFQYDDSSHSSEASFKQYADVTTDDVYHMTSREVKHYEAVKELFTTERSFLIGHLLILLEVFLEPLQQLQCDGYLLHVDARTVFGNIEELCSVTLHFCENLLHVVKNSSINGGYAEGILSAFETFESSICPPYQRYFSAFENSVTYTEELRSDNDFITFLQWCEQNPRCHRLKLNDFLVSPMQHLTKYPLLLRHIIKYTEDKNQTISLKRTANVVEESLKTLEGKVTYLAKYQFLQDLQNTISWPPVYEIEPKSVMPESLRQALKHQPCRNLLASTKRRLELEGVLSVIESGKTMEVYGFLFDDFLLITKPRKRKRRTCEIPTSLKRHPYMKDGTLLNVYRQPISLDRFMIYDVTDVDPSTTQKKSFVIVQENRFQQMISSMMLETSTEEDKKIWLTAIAKTAANWMEKHVYKIFPSANQQLTSPYLHHRSGGGSGAVDTNKLSVINTSQQQHGEEDGDSRSCDHQPKDEFEYFAAFNQRFSISSSSENGDNK